MFADGERFQILCARALLIANVILGLIGYNFLGPAERWWRTTLPIIFLILTTVGAVRMQFRSIKKRDWERVETSAWVPIRNDFERNNVRIGIGLTMLVAVMLNSAIILVLAVEG
jgi:hypothetical protein